MDYRVNISEIMQGVNYPEAGDRLYGVLLDNLDKDARIVLDFNGITLVPSMFLNTSLGRLIKERGVDVVKRKLGFCNIPMSQMAHIKEYVKRFAAS